MKDASVAQWIEQWPPELRAEVRFLSGAFLLITEKQAGYLDFTWYPACFFILLANLVTYFR